MCNFHAIEQKVNPTNCSLTLHTYVQGQAAMANRTIIVEAVCPPGEHPCASGDCAKVCPEALMDAPRSTATQNTAPTVCILSKLAPYILQLQLRECIEEAVCD